MKSIWLTVIALVIAWVAPRLLAQEQQRAREGARESAVAPAARDERGDAAEHDGAERNGAGHEAADHDGGPVSPDTHHRWPIPLMILILSLFVAAAVIGPIVRAQAPPPEMPATHSHDEPPGASHHHGHSGTINPVPEDVARLEQGRGDADTSGSGHHH